MLVALVEGGLAESLAREFDVSDVEHALPDVLVALELVREGEVAVAYVDETPWRRGGAETYVATARIELAGRPARRLLAKALVPFAGTTAGAQEVWLERRRLLEAVGIAVPYLYAVYRGTLYEQYITEEPRAIGTLNEDAVLAMARVVAGLDYLGFAPTDPMRDVRWDGDRPVYVDFGFDLGAPNAAVSPQVGQRLVGQVSVSLRSVFEEAWRERLAQLELREV